MSMSCKPRTAGAEDLRLTLFGYTAMDKVTRNQIELHTAGATVRHAGPYSDLDVPVLMETPNQDFITTWIKPFYMVDLVNKRDDFQHAYSTVRESVNDSLITQLLTFFDWRPRIVGAYFAAIENADRHCDHIGRLLLRSDVCFAGKGYALALARFNGDAALSYLCKYLDHYLQQLDFCFDQGEVMGALAYLDAANGTDIMYRYIDPWNHFIENKPYWDLDRSINRFAEQLQSINAIGKIAR